MLLESMPSPEEPVEVPYTAIAPETLRSLVEDFVTRDGTDYGLVEKSLEQKVAGLMRELVRGEAKIFYEQTSGTINIVAQRDLK